MNCKGIIKKIWFEHFCEGENRKALRAIIRASRLWHRGGCFNHLRAVLLSQRNYRKYGCQIYPQATLGEGLYIPHFVGIVVGSTSELGDNCTIFPNVVFGAAYHPNTPNPLGRRHPKCGDNCVFGTNASIIGKINIGNNVTVGAGSVVTKDIPDNAVVCGYNNIIKYK